MPIEMILKQNYGIEVDVATDGKSAIQMVQNNLSKTCCQTYYQLVFISLSLDGLKSAEQIKLLRKSHSKKLTIFAMDHIINKQTVEKCKISGMDGILMKPV
jgi:CheY-like chemotaxis protein